MPVPMQHGRQLLEVGQMKLYAGWIDDSYCGETCDGEHNITCDVANAGVLGDATCQHLGSCSQR